jgi:hypothetical protein
VRENSLQQQHRSTALPVTVVVLVLLAALYVGSYLLLVWPDAMRYHLLDSRWEVFPKYRYGTESWANWVYWPLEQIDRKLRPDEWYEVRRSASLGNPQSSGVRKNSDVAIGTITRFRYRKRDVATLLKHASLLPTLSGLI